MSALTVTNFKKKFYKTYNFKKKFLIYKKKFINLKNLIKKIIKYILKTLKKIKENKEFKIFAGYFIIFFLKLILNNAQCAPLLIESSGDLIEIHELITNLLESNNIKKIFLKEHECQIFEPSCILNKYAKDFIFQQNQIDFLENHLNLFKIDNKFNITQVKEDLQSAKEGLDKLVMDNLSNPTDIRTSKLYENLKQSTLKIFIDNKDVKTFSEEKFDELDAKRDRFFARYRTINKLSIKYIIDED